MSEEQSWAFPESVQPRSDQIQFDLERAFDAVVLVRSSSKWGQCNFSAVLAFHLLKILH